LKKVKINKNQSHLKKFNLLKSKISRKEFRISRVLQGFLVLKWFLSFDTVDWLIWLPKFSVIQSQTHRPWVGMKKCVLTMSTHDDSADFDLRTEISFLWQFHFSDPALPLPAFSFLKLVLLRTFGWIILLLFIIAIFVPSLSLWTFTSLCTAFKPLYETF